MMRALRKNLDIILIIVVVAFAVTIYYGYGSYRRSGRANQAVAATVNDTAITFYDLDQAFRNLLSRYDSKTLSQFDEKTFDLLRRLTLENLINNELLYQEAKSRRMKVSDQEVKQELDRLKSTFPSEKEFRNFLEYERVTLRDLQESLRRELMIQKLTDSLVEGVDIPEEEIQKYYEEHRNLFSTPAQYHLAQIVLLSQEEAEKALKRLYLGEDFATVAKEVSVDPSGKQGGDMGWVPETQLPEEAREAIKKVQDSPRAVTPIISRNNRFSIYRVLEWKPQEEKTYDEVKEDVKKMLLAEQKSVKTDHLLAELRQKSKINISELLQQVATPSPSPEASPTASPQNQQ
ncbi:MAG: SurA N-terminal domain-containing protein [Candidatus Caldatribacteriaceae bacterium]